MKIPRRRILTPILFQFHKRNPKRTRRSCFFLFLGSCDVIGEQRLIEFGVLRVVCLHDRLSSWWAHNRSARKPWRRRQDISHSLAQFLWQQHLFVAVVASLFLLLLLFFPSRFVRVHLGFFSFYRYIYIYKEKERARVVVAGSFTWRVLIERRAAIAPSSWLPWKPRVVLLSKWRAPFIGLLMNDRLFYLSISFFWKPELISRISRTECNKEMLISSHDTYTAGILP